MFTFEIEKLLVTKASTFRLKEKREERGRPPLNNIPLRSMLINGGVPITGIKIYLIDSKVVAMFFNKII